MKCKHYMMTSPTSIHDTAPLSQAVAMMVKKHMQDLLVVDDSGNFVGEITSFMFSKMLLPPQPAKPGDEDIETAEDVDNRLMPHLHRKVGEFVHREVPVVEPETPLSEALKVLGEGHLRIPVVSGPERKLVGALSSLTILRRFRF